MRITCPKCLFQQDVPDENIPPQAQNATCPKCKEKFQFREIQEEEDFLLEEEPKQRETSATLDQAVSETPEQDQAVSETPEQEKKTGDEDKSLWSTLEDMGDLDEFEPEEQNREDSRESSAAPWENLQHYGFFPGFFETVKRIMLAPGPFFSQMTLSGLGMPLGFFILVSVIQVLAIFLWSMTAISPSMAEYGIPVTGLGISLIFVIILTPLFAGAWLLVRSALTHIFLLAFQAGNSGFEGTFRATAYGSAPLILAVLPIFGPVIGTLWSLVVTIMGYRYIHGTSYTRVILALVVPFLLFILMVSMMMGAYGA